MYSLQKSGFQPLFLWRRKRGALYEPCGFSHNNFRENHYTECPVLMRDFSIDNFVSYVFRPKNSVDLKSNIENYNNNSTAIIIQGSIKDLEKFVEETLLIYKKLFKDNLIILSTWEKDIKNEFLVKFNNDKNIKIIINTKPITNFNVDLQTYSTNSALLYAEEKKITTHR